MTVIHKLAITTLAIISTSLLAGELLTNDQIQTTFEGKTAIGTNKKGGVKTYHATDGTALSSSGSGKKREGKWWTSKKKDAVCIKWEGEKKRCRTVKADGKGGYDKIHPKKGHSVTHYNELVDGNQTN